MDNKRILLSIVVVVIVGVFGSGALAGGPLGPPRASVGAKQWAVGVEYAREKVDLKSCGKLVIDGSTYSESIFKIKDLRSNIFFASLATGLAENWDVFVRLGAADAKDEIERRYEALTAETYDFDGSYGFAWGVGTKGTLRQSGPWTFGGVAQLTWIDPGDDKVSWKNPADPTQSIRGDVELDWRQFQAGIGVTYDAGGWSIYGGPCWFFVNGDLDFDSTLYTGGVPGEDDDYTHDLRQQEDLGGWVGVQRRLGDKSACYAEFQFVSEGWTFAVGLSMPLPTK